MIVAKYVAEFLKKRGIKNVFGYAGSMMLKLADEISLTEGLEYIQTFHEQGASFAANANSRMNPELPGVVLVTSGPGVINGLPGVADAFMDSLPLLFLSGNDRLTNMENNPGVRLTGFQDIDVVSVTSAISKYAVQIQSPDCIAYELEKSWHIACSGRKGPVVVDIPMDIQFEEVPEQLEHYESEKEANASVDCTEILRLLDHAKRPVILAGGGIRLANAVEEFRKFQEKTGIPVISTLNGRDASGDCIGMSGLYGIPTANLAIRNADLLLALGTRFGNRQVGKFPEEYSKAKIVHVDQDSLELGRVFEDEISVNCDLKLWLSTICHENLFRAKCLDEWIDQLKKWESKYHSFLYVNPEGLDPIAVVEAIGECAPEDAIFTNDVGQNEMWVAQALRLKDKQRLLSSSGYGSMGYSLPTAVGANIYAPTRTVVAFCGDGGFHMNIQELQFIKIHRNNIKILVFNNNTLGMMRDVQAIYYNNHFLGSSTDQFQCVNLEKIAAAYELNYFLLEQEKDLDAIQQIMNQVGPVIIDCRLSINSQVSNWTDFKKAYKDVINL